jgi:SAM-dependent methyltransferase
MVRYGDVVGDLRRAYDGGAERRDSLAMPPWKLVERRTFLDRVRAEGGRRLLEVGAGTGHDAAFFAAEGLEVVATDLSPAMVELCRAKGIDARVMDVLGLEFPRASFDAIYTVNCLLHVPDADLPAVLADLSGLLRPVGLMYLGVWGGQNREGTLENDDHEPKRFFAFRTDEHLQAYASRNFSIVDFHTVTSEGGERFQSLTLRPRASAADEEHLVSV